MPYGPGASLVKPWISESTAQVSKVILAIASYSLWTDRMPHLLNLGFPNQQRKSAKVT